MEHHTSRYVSTATGHQRSISETRKPIRGDWRAEAHDYESIRPLRRSDKESLSVSQSLARLKQDLHRILRSKTHYTLHMLAKAWMNETGTNPNEIAASFGFSSFKELLHSNQLKDIVEIDELETSSGAVETLYLAKSIKVTEHVRKPMYEPSSNADSILPDKEFIDQLKAMKEVGTENFIEAKRKILELLAQLGAEESPVTFSNLMQAYLIKYGVPLNKAEVKRLFGTSHPLQVFQSLMLTEVTVELDPTRTGIFYIRFKAPFSEILSRLDEAKKISKQPRAPERVRELRSFVPRRLTPDVNGVRSRRYSGSDFASDIFQSVKATILRSPTKRYNQPEARSPSPQPTIEFPEPRKIPSTSAQQNLTINGLSNVSDYRYKTKEQVIHNGKVFTKILEPTDFDHPKKKPEVAYTTPGDGYYTDEEEREKPKELPNKRTPASQTTASKNGRPSEFYDDDKEDDVLIEFSKEPENYVSQKWIKKSMDNENYRTQKEMRKLERSIDFKSGRLEELRQKAANPPKNSLIQDTKEIPERVVIKPAFDFEEKSHSVKLNENSSNAQVSPKSSSTEDEFENTLDSWSSLSSNSQPLKEVNSKQNENSSKESMNDWSNDETHLHLRIIAVRLNKMGLDKKTYQEALNDLYKVLEKYEKHEDSKPIPSPRSRFVTDA